MFNSYTLSWLVRRCYLRSFHLLRDNIQSLLKDWNPLVISLPNKLNFRFHVLFQSSNIKFNLLRRHSDDLRRKFRLLFLFLSLLYSHISRFFFSASFKVVLILVININHAILEVFHKEWLVLFAILSSFFLDRADSIYYIDSPCVYYFTLNCLPMHHYWSHALRESLRLILGFILWGNRFIYFFAITLDLIHGVGY